MDLMYFMVLVFTHWVADFVLQSEWMATHKSKNNMALLSHVGVYSITFFLVCLCLWPWHYAGVFMLTNGILHLITDYFTSRMTSKLWEEKRTHDFFVVVGFDQFIHYLCLAVTMKAFIV